MFTPAEQANYGMTVGSLASSLNTDYFDTTRDAAGCAAKGIKPEEDCRVATTSRPVYFFNYTGVRNLALGAYVRNLLNQFPALDRPNLTDNGGHGIPQQHEDAQERRAQRLSLEYKFL